MFGTDKTFHCDREFRGVSLAPNIKQKIKQTVFTLDLHRLPGMVELTGIEPVTSCLQSRRSPN
jgi:hypothetical protein